MRSMYAKMAANISSSLAGGGLPSGRAHGWMIPFMSRYRQSNSIPFGLGADASTVPSAAGSASRQSTTVFGYLSTSQR